MQLLVWDPDRTETFIDDVTGVSTTVAAPDFVALRLTDLLAGLVTFDETGAT